MSWLKHISSLPRLRRFVGVFVLLPVFAGCSFTPVYQTSTDNSQLAFNFAAPGNLMEQIVYQDLAARLDEEAGPDSPFLLLKVTSAVQGVGRTATGSVFNTQQVVATGHLIVYEDATKQSPLFDITRVATAQFDNSGQLLADDSAHANAETRAAHALAEALRLALYARFAPGAGRQ